MKSVHALSVLALATSACVAQSGAPADAAKQSRPVSFKISAQASHTFEADMKDGSGKSSVSRVGPELEVDFPIGEMASFSISASTEYSHYRFKDVTGFGTAGPKPIRNAMESELNLSYRRRIDENWSFFVAGGINAASENGADFGESLTYGGGGGATYTVNNDLQLGLGLIARTRLEEDTTVLPLPIVTWKFAPKWEFTTRYRNARINYQPAENWTIFATAEFEQHEYRLDNDAPASEGVFRDRTIPLSLGATYECSKSFEITAGAGVNVYRRMTVDDKSGNRIAKVKSDPSLMIFVNASIKF